MFMIKFQPSVSWLRSLNNSKGKLVIILLTIFFGLLFRTVGKRCVEFTNKTCTQFLPEYSMFHPALLDLVKRQYLQQSPGHLSYFLTNCSIQHNSQYGQDILIDSIFCGKLNGYFIEAGAEDGEFLSNTLFFERFRGWRGLLVEPSSDAAIQLRSKKRIASFLPNCLSDKAIIREYGLACPVGSRGICTKITYDAVETLKQTHTDYMVAQMVCIPLPTVLAALNVFKIDYMSLDVEGSELAVLKTIPIETFEITAISIEIVTLPLYGHKIAENLRAVRSFFAKQRFWRNKYSEIAVHGSDLLFVRTDFLRSRACNFMNQSAHFDPLACSEIRT